MQEKCDIVSKYNNMKDISKKSILKKTFLESQVKLLNPKPAIVISEKSSVRDAVKIMDKKKVGSVIVESLDKKPLGIFTERDVIKGFIEKHKNFLLSPVLPLISSPLQSIGSKASIARAIHIMSIGGFRHLGIIDEGQKLSMISIKDVLDFIHNALTKKIVADQFSTFFDENSVDLFFVSPVSLLKPKPPVWVKESATILEVVTLMHKKKVGCVLVGEDPKTLKGIFTERDFLLFASEVSSSVDTVTVGGCMTRDPKTSLQNSSVSLVLNLMCENGFRHIPIVDATEKLTGVLSVRDFFDYLSSHIVSELED